MQTEFPVFWEFLGTPRNSQKFPTMQISSDLKSLKLLGISGKGRLQFCEDLDFPAIPRNCQLYKLPIIEEGWNSWEFLGIEFEAI